MIFGVIIVVFTCVAAVWFLAGFMASEAMHQRISLPEVPKTAGYVVVTNGSRELKQ